MDQHLERLNGLAIFLQKPALAFIGQCEVKLHRKLMVVHGARSMLEQLDIWKKGRTLTVAGIWEITDPSQVVTNAKPGATPHNVITRVGAPASMAMDLIPFRADGAIDWEPGESFWQALYELSWDHGLDPLGDMIGAYLKSDKGHFEEPGWKLKLDGLGLLLPSAA